MIEPADRYARAFERGWEPEPYETVSEWADLHRILSSEASAEPGQWRTSRTPYLREIMDTLSPHSLVQRTVFMAASQLGKTECGNNWLGHIIHRAPGPLLVVEPTLLVAKRVSKQRIAPMIAATPVLRGRVSEARTRDSGNTTFEKSFPGGLLIMTGANSSAGLRSMPIRYLFCDEIDEYPGDVEGQGDPVALAERRTATFARRKVFLVSTPTVKDFSRIEREWLATDQRRYFVPCPACGHMDWIQWSAGGYHGDQGKHHHMVWEAHDPETIRMECASCGERIEERHKATMLERGRWQPTALCDPRIAGFHVSSLYSPLGWKSWAEILSEFLEAKSDPPRLKTWINTILGETFEEKGDSVEPHVLLARVEHYKAEVPTGIGALVGAVDVQHDRLEVSIYGFGHAEESWLVAHTQIWGDPGQRHVWHSLDEFMAGPWEHESGRKMLVLGYAVDSGGHHTEEVYKYCEARAGRSHVRPFCIKGGSIASAPLVSKPTRTNRFRVKLFTLGVNTGKDAVLSRLKVATPGPGYVHLPHWIDLEFCQQITAERSVRRYVKNKGVVREWVKVRERNEAFDLAVYALATLHILGPALVRRLDALAQRWALPLEEGEAAADMPPEPSTAQPAAAQRARTQRAQWPLT